MTDRRDQEPRGVHDEPIEISIEGDDTLVDAAAVRSQDPMPSDAEEVAVLRAELTDLRDRSIRTLADFDNFRKRTEREREEIRRYATGEALREMLGVVDNLELARKAGGSLEDVKSGVEMIARQFEDVLRRLGLREVPAVGQPFDPSLHEAVARREDRSVDRPTIAAVLRRGWLLHDRLLRPAMVEVAVPAEADEGSA